MSQTEARHPYSTLWRNGEVSPFVQWVIAVALSAVLVTWIDFSSIHEHETADTLMPVLISILKWTPFYWGQNRFGMLIALLAWPIHAPLANLLVQFWLGIFATMLASFLLVRYMLGDNSPWVLVGMIVNFTALVLLPLDIQCDAFIEPYAPSLVLGIFAFLVLEEITAARVVLALILMLTAHWVNCATFVILAPLTAFRYLTTKKTSDIYALVITLAGACGGWIMMKISRFYEVSPHLRLLRISELKNSWAHLFHSSIAVLGPSTFAYSTKLLLFYLLFGFSAAACVAGYLIHVTDHKRALIAAGVIFTSGLCSWLAIGTLAWIRDNLFSVRYVLSPLLLIVTAAAIPLALLLKRKLGSLLASTALIALTLAAMGYRYGAPSIARVRGTIDHNFGYMTNDIIESGATVIAGNYWRIWPIVFHVNLTLHDEGYREAFHGLSERSVVTAPIWSNLIGRGLCLAAPLDDPESATYMKTSKVEFSESEKHGTVRVFYSGPEHACKRSPSN